MVLQPEIKGFKIHEEWGRNVWWALISSAMQIEISRNPDCLCVTRTPLCLSVAPFAPTQHRIPCCYLITTRCFSVFHLSPPILH